MKIIKLNLWALTGCLLVVLLMSVGCGSTANNTQPEEQYTPIALYFNPLEQLCPNECVDYFPIFENYPNDWEKYGLQGRPHGVANDFDDVTWNVRYSIETDFNDRGQLIQTLNSAWKIGNEFNYDPAGKLMEIVSYDKSNSRYVNRDQKSTFKYDGETLVSWDGNTKFHSDLFPSFGIKQYRYEYYPDSTLRTVMPVNNSNLRRNSKLGTFEFNEKGQLIRMISPASSNPFFTEFSPESFDVKSEVDFTYNNAGQCITKVEKLILTVRKKGEIVTDTLPATSHYQYNDKNDLIRWVYNGVTAERDNSGSVNTTMSELAIEFDYEYDQCGNWVNACCILPEDFQSYSVLKKFLNTQKQQSPYIPHSEKYDKARTIEYRRTILGYYDDVLASEEGTSENKQVSSGEERPKYSGREAYGLQGPVKMLKNETTKQTIVFNKIGNIETFISDNGYRDCNNTYIYDSPFTYSLDDIKYQIECSGDTLRYINENEKEIFSFEDEYQFDAKGRVVCHTYFDGMMGVTEEYVYKGDNRLPYKEVLSNGDELGNWTTTTEYEYVSIDKHGNWTKRIGTYKTVSNEYEDVMNDDGVWDQKISASESTGKNEEIRTITYY